MIHRYFEFVLKEPIDLKDLPYPKKEYKLPEVLSKHEAELIYKQIHNVKHKAIFCLLYGCGLRRSEVLHLKPHDIDRTRMIVNVRQAKNNKDRQVMLDKKLLLLLEQYYRQYRPTEYMFNGQYGNIYSGSSINLFLKYYSKKARVKKKVKAHTLRHSFATHLLEDGVDISIIQKLLGHASLKTTLIYVHISNKHISGIKSPVSSFLK
jgi:site-specific recombinase XerD